MGKEKISNLSQRSTIQDQSRLSHIVGKKNIRSYRCGTAAGKQKNIWSATMNHARMKQSPDRTGEPIPDGHRVWLCDFTLVYIFNFF